MVSVGIFSETEPKHFQLTPLADCLQDDSPNSVRNFLILRSEQDYACWGNLMYSLRTGESAFEHTYGMPRYQYNKQNPALAELFEMAGFKLTRVIPTTLELSIIEGQAL